MEKIDFRKELKLLYQPSSKEVVELDVPPMNFLMVDGEGDPNTTQAYADAIEALFSVAYTLKFMVKKGDRAIDFAVLPLESLWWADDMAVFASGDKSRWKWTAMIMQPSFVTLELVERALEEVKKRKNPAALAKVRFELFSEGRSAQIMHIGPFSEEGPTIEHVHRFICDRNCQLRGKHHEIYLSDIRRADSSKWKTVIRQPMQ